MAKKLREDQKAHVLSMPKHWNKARAREALAKYFICGDHLVPIGECGCEL